ncbi:hypothetical protein T484DRAFT_1782952 [Baffinella frigidus]|nr:hypothetical protein T484DRAFT_1782952 [Cryptophyta sp. CCMP2293]
MYAAASVTLSKAKQVDKEAAVGWQVDKEAAVGWQVLHIAILRDYLHLELHIWRVHGIDMAEQVDKEAAVGWQVLHIAILRDYLHLELQFSRPLEA